MAIYYVDFENGTDTQTGQAPVVKTGCVVTLNQTTVTVPSSSGISIGMKVFSTDMNNSGNLLSSGVTVVSVSGVTITLSAVSVASSSNATLIFSPALKTLTAAVAKTSPGDTVRVKTSRVTNTGLSGNWANKSSTLTLNGTAPYLIIDQCETAWSNNGLGNGSTVTSVLGSVQGTNILQISNLSYSSNNGVVAYKTLPQALDLSSYSQISFVYGDTNTSIAAGSYILDLCSDSLGQTPIHSVTLRQAVNNGGRSFAPFVFNFGSSLSNSIRSLAIRRVGGGGSSGSGIISIDNIVACKSPDAADCLTHLSVVSKNTSSEWWPVVAFEQNQILLSPSSSLQSGSFGAQRGYSGITEVAGIFKAECLANPGGAFSTSGASGTQAQPIVVSGGWDSISMSNNNGITAISLDGAGALTVSSTYGVLENFVFKNPPTGSVLTVGGSIKNTSFITTSLAIGNNYTTFENVRNISAFSNSVTLNQNVTKFRAKNCKFLSSAGSGIVTSNINTSPFVNFAGIELINCNIDNHTSTGILTSTGGAFADFTMRGGSIVDNGTSTTASVSIRGTMKAINVKVNEASSYTFVSGSYRGNEIRVHNYNGVVNDHRVYSDTYLIKSETQTRRTQSGLAWKISPSSLEADSRFPVSLPLAQVLVDANKPVTATVWVQRDSTALFLGLRCKGGQISGVAEDVISFASSSGQVWEQLTITFTPTSVGVVELDIVAYGGVSNSGFVDDFSVSQPV